MFTALLLVLLGLVAVRWVGELGSSPAATPLSGLDDPGRYQFYHRSSAETAQLARTDAESSNGSDAP